MKQNSSLLDHSTSSFDLILRNNDSDFSTLKQRLIARHFEKKRRPECGMQQSQEVNMPQELSQLDSRQALPSVLQSFKRDDSVDRGKRALNRDDSFERGKS